METKKSNKTNTMKNRFKSYYVVWKRMTLKKIDNILEKFKSYYVVWKRHTHNCILYFEKSLNRTM